VKANLAYLDVEADFDLENEETRTEVVGGDVESEYNHTIASGDMDGDGILAELGVGYEVIQSLRLEGSLSYGRANVDTKKVNGYDLYVKQINGEEVDREIDSGVWPWDVEADIATFVGMADANYVFTDLFMPDSPFSAFAGLGLGFAYNMLDEITIKFEDEADGPQKETIDGDSSVDFAWRINVGAEYAINEQWTANLTYQYMDLGTAEADQKGIDDEGEGEFDLTAHALSIGATYKF
jgi:opacity protein-like surface antigen